MNNLTNTAIKTMLGLGALMLTFAHSQAASPWISLMNRYNHSCALTSTGKAYCWGGNQSGVLGTGSDEISKVPTPLKTDLSFSSIAPGINHTCAITKEGKAYCWGRNDRFQLGMAGADDPRQTYPDILVPTPVQGDLVFSSISAGYFHTCGLVTGGKAYCWGANEDAGGVLGGQLGDGSKTSRQTPVPVARGLTFADVQAAREFSCGRTATGRMK